MNPFFKKIHENTVKELNKTVSALKVEIESVKKTKNQEIWTPSLRNLNRWLTEVREAVTPFDFKLHFES